MYGTAKPEEQAQPMTVTELSRFCQAVHGMANAIIEGVLSNRQRGHLDWILDQLFGSSWSATLGWIRGERANTNCFD